MKRTTFVLFVLVGTLCFLGRPNTACAAITWTGNIDPVDPMTWDGYTTGYVGKTADGTLTVDADSDLRSSSALIGYGSTVMGKVTVTGSGSKWTNGGLVVGDSGSGMLAIADSGAVSSSSAMLGNQSGSTGRVTVDGTGSKWNNNSSLYVGYSGSGRLAISGGADVVSCYSLGDGYIGFNSDSDGEVTVDGSGSTWTNKANLFVGNSGSGSLAITNGGYVSTYGASISYNAGSDGKVTVDGAGSKWINSGTLSVGYSDNGSLAISKGAAARTNGATLGCTSGSNGEVTVDGVGSTWTIISSMHVGSSGNGRLKISDGAAFSGGTQIYIGFSDNVTGEVTVDGTGSKWTSGGDLFLGFSGNGTLAIRNGATFSSETCYLGYNPAGDGEVTVDGVGSTWKNSGNLYVAHSGNATLAVSNGGLVSVRGLLTIDKNNNGSQFIDMSAGGRLALFGEADDSLVNFLGLIDGTDAIRYWNHSISDWADIADATRDADYTLVYVDDSGSDLYGYTVLSVGTVPEPSTIALLVMGAICLLLRILRRRP